LRDNIYYLLFFTLSVCVDVIDVSRNYSQMWPTTMFLNQSIGDNDKMFNSIKSESKKLYSSTLSVKYFTIFTCVLFILLTLIQNSARNWFCRYGYMPISVNTTLVDFILSPEIIIKIPIEKIFILPNPIYKTNNK